MFEMSGCDVKATVVSIVSALAAIKDINRKREGKQQLKHTNKKAGRRDFQAELSLRDSLRKRPLEIQDEYDRSVKEFGNKFAIGDTIAQAGLSHILLVLNVGLMNVLSILTSDNLRDQQSLRHLLLQLSETTGKDAVSEMRRLCSRLSTNPSQVNPVDLAAAQSSFQRNLSKQLDRRPFPNSGTRVKQSPNTSNRNRALTQRRSATVRIAWVRPLRGKLSENKRSSTQVDTSNSCNLKNASRRVLSGADEPVKPPSKETTSAKSAVSCHEAKASIENGNRESSSPKSYSMDVRKPNARVLTHKGSRIRQELAQTPPIPPKLPLYPQHGPPPIPPKEPIMTISRRPVSAYSFVSDSTKIGEIPEHRLPTWAPASEEPYAGLISAQQLKRQKRHPFKFWRK